MTLVEETREAAEALRQRAVAGERDAKAALARHLLRHPPFDVPEAIGWARQAAEEGDAESARLLAMLSAEGLGLPQDWKAALDFTARAALLGSHRAQAELAALNEDWPLAKGLMAGEDATRDWNALRRTVNVVHWLHNPPAQGMPVDALVAVSENFLTHDLCDWFVARHREALQPAKTYDPQTGQSLRQAARANSSAQVDITRMDMVLTFIRARIAAMTKLFVPGFEDTGFLHYATGEQYLPHYDFLDTSLPGHAEDVAAAGQRAMTFLVYLNDDFEGGETDFPKLSWRFKGRKGDALFFVNILRGGAPDRRTLHAGLPPIRGEKYLLSQWIRLKATA